MSAAIPLLEVAVTAHQLAAVRTRAREVGELLGFDGMQQTRFSTAVSEVARNAVQHGGGAGVVRFVIDHLAAAAGQGPVQRLLAEVRDHGPGLPDAAAAMQGCRRSDGRLTMGLVGTARLVDVLEIEAPSSGGTLVRLGVLLPRTSAPLDAAAIAVLSGLLGRREPASPAEELEHQNSELLRTLQVLREKQAELEAADQRKNDFVAMLAHELRNPLATLEMNLEILHRKPQMASDELAERGAVMRRQTRQLTQLVADLMDASQVSQGKVKLQMEPVEMHDLVAQALEMSSGFIAAKHHLVVSRSDAADVAWVNGDAGRLRQVLSNLLQNSARYTPAGGRIVVSVTKDASHACVAVQDNGVGMAADVLPHVFGMFVQGDVARSQQEGGLGVGLALVQRLVSDHGGTVVAASEGVGLGCTVTVRLPLAAPAA